MRVERPGFLIHGAVSLEYAENAVRPWRLPHHDRSLFYAPDDNLVSRAGKTSGVRLQFRTDARLIRLSLRMTMEAEHDNTSIDLVQEGELLESVRWDPAQTHGELVLAGSAESIYELWLPTFSEVWLEAVEFVGAGFLDPGKDERSRWVTYGSSITHCRGAASPARSWPATAARTHRLHLTNLGLGGQCHLDGAFARVIRDLDAHVITLKLGINVYGGNSLGPRTFIPAILSFVQTIRERHRETPIGLISPIWGCERESSTNALGMTLAEYRTQVEEAAALLRDHGDTNLHFFDGLELLGEADAGYLPDSLHPNGDGYELMGRRVAERILPALLQRSVTDRTLRTV